MSQHPATHRDPMIAIVGIGCRFPRQMNSPAALWSGLNARIDTTAEVPASRWDVDALFDADRQTAGKTYVRRGSFLDDAEVEGFDPTFFGISPREAAYVDPQQRLLLETTYEAMEDAGWAADALRGSRAGVFMGLFIHDYQHILLRDRQALSHYTNPGIAMSIAANRISYAFDLQGPSLALDTACSSALVAIHQACVSLRTGESSVAFAGGVNVILGPENTVGMSKASMLSPDGRCHSFDARANGYVRGEGAGVLALKRLGDALGDGDPIYAVIRASGTNQDGGQKAGITVPNGQAQRALLRETIAQAGLQPHQIQYAEAHGTGTPVGDPIEANALGEVLGEGRAAGEVCWLGSIKSNIGHSESASGAAGIIKAALCLKHQRLVPNLHFKTPNPGVDFERLKLRVVTEAMPWAGEFATVNSFGFGGANANVVLQSAQGAIDALGVTPAAPTHEPGEQGARFVRVSGHTPEAMRANAAALSSALEEPEPLDALAHTTTARRSPWRHRAVVFGDAQQVRAGLEAVAVGELPELGATGESRGVADEVVWVFTGMGPQRAQMGVELMAQEPAFAETMKRCDALFRRLGSFSIIERLQASAKHSLIQQTRYAQPAILSVQAALADLLKSKGVTPTHIVGHSVGEWAAAYAAGALSLEEAGRVIYHRSRLQHTTEGHGKIMAVGVSLDECERLLADYPGLSLAAINGPASISVAGDAAQIELLRAQLEAGGEFARVLDVEVPYHSPMMDPLEQELRASLAQLTSAEPEVALYSTVLGRRSESGELDAGYCWGNVRAPVRFAEAIEAMALSDGAVFMELGPQPVLKSAIYECAGARSVPTLRRGVSEARAFGEALAGAHVRGVAVDWSRVNPTTEPLRLPPYQWQRERYWAESEQHERYRKGRPMHTLELADEAPDRLLGVCLPTARPTWQSAVCAEAPAFLGDHQIDAAVVFPGAGYVQNMLAALARTGDESAGLIDVDFTAALFMEPEQSYRLQTVREGDTLRVLSCPDDAPNASWTAHVSARVDRGQDNLHPTLDPQATIKRLGVEPFGPVYAYQYLRECGLRYGPTFQGVQQVWHGEAEALVEVSMPEAVRAELGEETIHPAWLDALLHTGYFSMAFDGAEAARRGEVYLPVRVRRVLLHQPPDALASARWVHTTRTHLAESFFEFDVRAYDADGRALMELLTFRCQRLSSSPAERQRRHDGWCYREQWQPAQPLEPVERMEGRWLVVGDTPVARQLTRALHQRRAQARPLIEGPQPERTQGRTLHAESLHDPTAWVDVWATLGDEVSGVLLCVDDLIGSAVDTAEALVEAHRRTYGVALAMLQSMPESLTPRVCFITRGAQAVTLEEGVPGFAQATLWGLRRVLANERPELRSLILDLPAQPEPAEPTHILAASLDEREDEVALRDGAFHTLRLQPAARQEQPLPTTLTRDYELVIEQPGALDTLTFRPAHTPAPGPGEVQIEVKAWGVNFKDVMKAMGLFPSQVADESLWGLHTLGMECAGVVHACGRDVTEWSVGDRVVAFQNPGFGSLVLADARLCASMPARFNFAEAAALPVVLTTAWYGLVELARVQPGERVLVHGASGGVGQAALALLRQRGARVLASAGSAHKRAWLREQGIEHVFDSRALDFAERVLAATDGQGVDVVLNALPGDGLQRSLSVLADYGRFVELGKKAFDDNDALWMRPFMRNISFHALDLDRLTGQRPEVSGAALRAAMGAYDSPPLPMQTFEVERASEAFRLMVASQHTGKLVITLPERGVEVALCDPMVVRADASYLVTGGLGGFGLETARWLVERGARHLILSGRSGDKKPAARAAVAALRAMGAEVRVVVGDVVVRGDVQRMVSAATSERPLKGVFHAAGLLRDALLSRDSIERAAQVFAPKVTGAWLLHEACAQVDLDHFVVFSSATVTLGNVGSGNYVAANAALDALIAERRASGLPGQSVRWGMIAEAGMVNERPEYRRDTLVRPLHAPTGLGLMARHAAHESGQITIAAVDWSALAIRGAQAPRFEAFSSGSSPPGDEQAGLVRQLQRGELGVEGLTEALAEALAPILGLSLSRFDVQESLSDQGLDSLVAIEMRAALERLGFAVPFSKLLRGVSTVALAAELVAQHSGGETFALATAEPRGEGPWWVCQQAQPEASMQLFCVAYAGGGPAVFKGWRALLGGEAELYVAQLPGRAQRLGEPPLRDVQQMARGLADALAARLDGRPFAVFGHCLGAILGYEAICHLGVERGVWPARFFASAAAAPGQYATPNVFSRTDESLLEILSLIGFTASSALVEDEELRGLVFPPLRGDFEAAARYGAGDEQRAVLPVPITALAGREDLFAAPSAVARWGEYTSAGFELGLWHGSHYYLEARREQLVARVMARLRGEPMLAVDGAAAPRQGDVVVLERDRLPARDEAMGEVRLRQLRPGRRPVVVLPAGFGARVGEALLEVWPEGRALWIVELPGWSGEGAPARDFGALLDATTRAIEQLGQSVVLLSHDVGNMLGYHLARRLGERVAGLVVSGSGAPQHYVVAEAHRLSTEELLTVLRVIGHPQAERWSEAPQRFEDGPGALIRADLQLMSSVPTEDPAQQLRVPIQAIVHEDSMWTFPTVVPRWRDFTSGPSAVTTLPGEHFTAVEQPQQLLDALARLDASR